MLCVVSVWLLTVISLCAGRPKKAMTSREAVMSMRMGPVNPQGQSGVDFQQNPLAPPMNPIRQQQSPMPTQGRGPQQSPAYQY